MDREKILEAIGNMTVLELSELVKEMEDKFGVSAAAPMAMAMPAAAGAAEEAEEQTEFDVVLESFEKPDKIKIIKVLREVTALGLKEAKDLVEAAPKAIKEAVPKEEAEEVAAKFKELKCKVVLK